MSHADVLPCARARGLRRSYSPLVGGRTLLALAEAAEGDHARLLALYRSLARLRRERAELTDSHRAGHAAESAGPGRWLLHRGAATVWINLSAEPWRIDIASGDTVWLATVEVAGPGGLVLPPDAAAVVGPPA